MNFKKQKSRLISESALCGKRDLNPYGVYHTPLKRARLPVPPLPRASRDCLTDRLYYTTPHTSCQVETEKFFKGFFSVETESRKCGVYLSTTKLNIIPPILFSLKYGVCPFAAWQFSNAFDI